MKVLHVISGIDPRLGGSAIALHGLSRAQARAGLRVRILSTFRHGANHRIVEQLEDDGVGVELVGPCHTPLSWHWSLPASLRRAAAWADVVHLHKLWEDAQHHGARAATRLGRPYVLRPCGMLDPWSLSQSRWRKRLFLALRYRRHLDGASALHFTTRAEAELTRPLGLRAPHIVEPNGLDWDEFGTLPPPGAFRARYPALGDRPFVLFLSRVHPKKGLDLLLPAFAEAAPEPTMLVVAGPASRAYREKLERQVESLGLGPRVLFTGMLDGPARLEAYVAADLFALTSRQENFGIVVAEALACGTAVLVSRAVNIQQEIVDAGVGEAVEMRLEDIVDGLSRWLRDAQIRGRARARARQFARERFDWARIADRWGNHYVKLVSHP